MFADEFYALFHPVSGLLRKDKTKEDLSVFLEKYREEIKWRIKTVLPPLDDCNREVQQGFYAVCNWIIVCKFNKNY